MSHDHSPQANGLNAPTQPFTDAEDERFMTELQALYLAPQIPHRLQQTGAEQARLQLAASKRQHARHEVFGLLRRLHAGAQRSDRPGGSARREGASRPAIVAAVAAMALVSVLAAALFTRPGLLTTGSTSTTGHAQHIPTPTVSLDGPPMTLMSVAMVSVNDGWAFGSTGGAGGECLVLHYNGAHWARSPNSACAPVTSIAMLSADDGWAVGYDTILHYTHGNWRVDTIYAPPGQHVVLERVAMVSPDEGWVVGWASTPNSSPALILHYANGHWTPANVAGLASDSASGLRGIAMVSAREGWAVGSQITSSGGEKTLVLHYTNGRWTRLDWSIPGSFNSVAAFSSGDVWAVGEDNPAAGPGLVVHLRNGVPIQEDRPIPGLLQDIAMVSPSEGWAIGDGAATVRYHDGVWTREGLTIHQYYMMNISLVSATEGWAVGSSAVSPSRDPNASATLFHLSGGVWRIYPLSGV